MTFGPTPEMFDKAKQMGLEAFIEEQLFPKSIPEPEIDSLLQRFPHAEHDRLHSGFGSTGKASSDRELIDATIVRQQHSQRQVHEMMVDFWSTHFSIYIGRIPVPGIENRR